MLTKESDTTLESRELADREREREREREERPSTKCTVGFQQGYSNA